MKNITSSADEKPIEAARGRARAEHTTLNDQFRRWSENYTQQQERVQPYDEVVTNLKGRVRVRREFTCDGMNKR